MRARLTLLLLLTLLPGADPAADDDIAAINQVYADWRRAVLRADIPGYVAVLAEDVRLMPPDADAIVGKGRYAAFLEPVFAAASYRIEVVLSPQVEVVGDLAVAEYEYVIHLAMRDGAEISEPGAITAARSHNRYFDVLRRNQTGDWLVWRHTWRTL